MTDIIFPYATHREFHQYLRSQYEIWRTEHEATQPRWVPENVRFRHNPEWREHFWSVSYIRAGHSPFWNGVGALFWIAQFLPPLIAASLK
jgi:hypothetical protein